MDIILKDISDEWKDILKLDLDDIVNKISICKELTPCLSKVFQFARETPLKNIKIVILGQDPYPKAGEACGSAFKCFTNIPPSLKNIYKCLLSYKLIRNMPETGDLTLWETQGVLLLNTALTTLIGQSNVHKNIWKDYMIKLINNISLIGKRKKIIFFLWGNNAKSFKQYIHESCDVLEYSHPSPLSGISFTYCSNFIEANNILIKSGITPINWNIETELTEVEKQFNMSSDVQVVFTDGSCYPNKLCKEAKAGYSVVFALGTMENTILYGSINNTVYYASNQRAEGIAIYKALKYLQNNGNKWNKLIIVTDSEFWINMYSKYMPSWAKETEYKKFKEKANSDITINMWNTYKELVNEHFKEIEFRHIRSHDKDKWSNYSKYSYEYFCYTYNTYADELAGYARENCEVGTDEIGIAEIE